MAETFLYEGNLNVILELPGGDRVRRDVQIAVESDGRILVWDVDTRAYRPATDLSPRAQKKARQLAGLERKDEWLHGKKRL